MAWEAPQACYHISMQFSNLQFGHRGARGREERKDSNDRNLESSGIRLISVIQLLGIPREALSVLGRIRIGFGETPLVL